MNSQQKINLIFDCEYCHESVKASQWHSCEKFFPGARWAFAPRVDAVAEALAELDRRVSALEKE